jgi:hypothetical protein
VPVRGDHVLLWHNSGTGGFREAAGFMLRPGVGVVALAKDCAASTESAST